jgi:hypothetical protein
MRAPATELQLACLDILTNATSSENYQLGAAAALKWLSAFLLPDEILVACSLEAATRMTHLPFVASCLVEVAALGPNRAQVEKGLAALLDKALEEGRGEVAWVVLNTLLSTAPEPPAIDFKRVASLAHLLIRIQDPRPLASMIRFFDHLERDVPPWACEAIRRRPELLEGLDDITLEHVHRAVPTPEGWLLLAHRSTIRTRFTIAAPLFGAKLPDGLDTLRQAADTDLGREDAAIGSWLRGWEKHLLKGTGPTI